MCCAIKPIEENLDVDMAEHWEKFGKLVNE